MPSFVPNAFDDAFRIDHKAMSDVHSSSEAKRLALNLNVLKRHDASIVEIVDSTSYVVLYRYGSKDGANDGAPQWTKTGIEGSMFLFRRSAEPIYGFFILNRHSVSNFADDLVNEANLELTPEYIIVQSSNSDDIHGIWIFEEEHRARIGRRMIELCQHGKNTSSLAAAVATVPQPPSVRSSPLGSSANRALPIGQQISLDVLFGNANSSSPLPVASSLPLSQNALQQHNTAMFAEGASSAHIANSGVAQLETLFSQAHLSAALPTASFANPIDPSPTSRERLVAAQANAIQAAKTDEEALKTLLGLPIAATIPTTLAVSPQSVSSLQMPPPATNPLRQSRGPLPVPVDYASAVSPRNSAQNAQLHPQNGAVIVGPPPQPVAQAKQSHGQSRTNTHISIMQRPQPMQSVSANTAKASTSTPLMPSVILNKKLVSPKPASAAASSPQPIYASPWQSAQILNDRATSVPPPAVPDASRPSADGQGQSVIDHSHIVQQPQQVMPGPPSNRGPGLPPAMAFDIMQEELSRTPGWAPLPQRPPGAPTFDRHQFRLHMLDAMNDPHFMEVLYQRYLAIVVGRS